MTPLSNTPSSAPSPGSSLVLAPVTGTWLVYKAPTPPLPGRSPGAPAPETEQGLSIIHLNIQHCHKVYQAFFYMLLSESGKGSIINYYQLSIVCYTSNINHF